MLFGTSTEYSFLFCLNPVKSFGRIPKLLNTASVDLATGSLPPLFPLFALLLEFELLFSGALTVIVFVPKFLIVVPLENSVTVPSKEIFKVPSAFGIYFPEKLTDLLAS